MTARKLILNVVALIACTVIGVMAWLLMKTQAS
jgi:hypothetical protein